MCYLTLNTFFSLREKSRTGDSWVLLLLIFSIFHWENCKGSYSFILFLEESLEIILIHFAWYYRGKLWNLEKSTDFFKSPFRPCMNFYWHSRVSCPICGWGWDMIWYRIWNFCMNNYFWLVHNKGAWDARALRFIIM